MSQPDYIASLKPAERVALQLTAVHKLLHAMDIAVCDGTDFFVEWGSGRRCQMKVAILIDIHSTYVPEGLEFYDQDDLVDSLRKAKAYFWNIGRNVTANYYGDIIREYKKIIYADKKS